MMTIQPATQRLNRLEAYLREDPANVTLMGDVFDTALEVGDWVRAEWLLLRAKDLGASSARWQLREAHWLLAQHRWNEAEPCLRTLSANPDLQAEFGYVIAHDLGHVALMRGEFESGLAQIAPWVDGVAPSEPLATALQVLWLRLMHRLQRLDDALAWAVARWDARQLAPSAAGVASLIALDINQGLRSLQWADHALQQDKQHVEASVARATLALSENDAASARQLLAQALQCNANDGRTLSTLGFTDLLELQLDAAHDNFQRAVGEMPGHIGTWHGLGWTLLLKADLDGAKRAFETALALDRNFGESHGGVAVVLALSQQRAEAELAIERAVRLDRGSLSARYAQALLRGEARDAQAIRRLANRLLQGRPTVLGGSMLDSLVRAVPGAGGSSPDVSSKVSVES